MKTLIDALCKQLTTLDRQATLVSWSASAQDARRKFNAVHSTIETYGYIINWSHAGQCFEAEFSPARAELLGIPECVWPEAALEAHEAAKAAAVPAWGRCDKCGETHNNPGVAEACAELAKLPRCWHGRKGWCESCASS